MLVLVAATDYPSGEALRVLLERSGYQTDVGSSQENVEEMAEVTPYDLLLIDDPTPQVDWLELVARLRAQQLDMPIMLLIPRISQGLKVRVLDAGADDCLTKPYWQDELLARIRALLRRTGQQPQAELLQTDDFSFSPQAGWVKFAAMPEIQLTRKESSLLELLLRNQGRVLEKWRIYEKIWGYDALVSPASVELYVHYLRRKLKTDCLRTVRGIGYMWRSAGEFKQK